MIVELKITYDLADDATEQEAQDALDDATEAGRAKLAATHDFVNPPVGIIVQGP